MSELVVLMQGEKGFELAVNNAPNWVMLKEVGYSPVQSVVAAVASCGGYVYQHLLKNSHIEYTFEKVEARYERHDDKVGALSKIDLTFFVRVASENRDKAEAIVRLVARYCPVIQSLDKLIVVTENVVML